MKSLCLCQSHSAALRMLTFLAMMGCSALFGQSSALADQTQQQSGQSALAPEAPASNQTSNETNKTEEVVNPHGFVPPCVCALIDLGFDHYTGLNSYYSTVHPTPGDCSAGVYSRIIYGNHVFPNDCSQEDECIDYKEHKDSLEMPFRGHIRLEIPKDPSEMIEDGVSRRIRVTLHDETRIAEVTDSKTGSTKNFILFTIKIPVAGDFKLVHFGYELPARSARFQDPELQRRKVEGKFERNSNPFTRVEEQFLGTATVTIDGHEMKYAVILKKP